MTLVLASCIATPQVAPDRTTTDVKNPTVVSARGNPLTAAKAKQLLHTGDDIGQKAMLTELVRVIETISGDPLIAGNDVRPSVDGPKTLVSMFKAIQSAQHHIHLETFILDDDEIGRELSTRLIERRRAGIKVRIIYDAFGSRNASTEFIEKLTDAGVELYKYHPINPAEDYRICRSNNRDHRKILIVDGKIVFTGGINISEVYAENSLSTSKSGKTREDAEDGGWRDTHVRITGLAAHRLQDLFLKVWKEYQPDTPLDAKKFYPAMAPQGDILVRVVASRGGDEEYETYTVLLAAVAHARQRIWITQAYFTPNDAFWKRLKMRPAVG